MAGGRSLVANWQGAMANGSRAIVVVGQWPAADRQWFIADCHWRVANVQWGVVNGQWLSVGVHGRSPVAKGWRQGATANG